MAIEQTLESIASSLAAIATVMQTQAQATATLGAAETPAAATERKTRAKKADAPAVPNEAPAATPAAPAPVAPTTEVVATPAPATPAASTASSQKPWAEVLAKVIEVNKSPLPTAGRTGVKNILAHFFGADVAGIKVPDLEGLNRHDEVLAFAASLLEVAPADDDLGL